MRYLEMTEFLGDAYVPPDDKPVRIYFDLCACHNVFIRWGEKSGLPCIELFGSVSVAFPMKTFEDAERLAGKLMDKIIEAKTEDEVRRSMISAGLHQKANEGNMRNFIDEIKKW